MTGDKGVKEVMGAGVPEPGRDADGGPGRKNWKRGRERSLDRRRMTKVYGLL